MTQLASNFQCPPNSTVQAFWNGSDGISGYCDTIEYSDPVGGVCPSGSTLHGQISLWPLDVWGNDTVSPTIDVWHTTLMIQCEKHTVSPLPEPGVGGFLGCTLLLIILWRKHAPPHHT